MPQSTLHCSFLFGRGSSNQGSWAPRGQDYLVFICVCPVVLSYLHISKCCKRSNSHVWRLDRFLVVQWIW